MQDEFDYAVDTQIVLFGLMIGPGQMDGKSEYNTIRIDQRNVNINNGFDHVRHSRILRVSVILLLI